MNIVLTGFMGTGKTVTGKIVSERLGMEFIDTDKIIEEREKDRIVRIFQRKGEKYFRKIEEEVIEEVSKRDNCVIATGGGAIISERNFKNLKKNGILICLSAKPSVIFKRTFSSKDRPLLLKSKPAIQIIKELLEKRKPYYSKADYTIDTSSLKPEQVAEKIIEIYKNEKNKNKT